jgi:hypothetical protein
MKLKHNAVTQLQPSGHNKVGRLPLHANIPIQKSKLPGGELNLSKQINNLNLQNAWQSLH